jgi:hypothetical protein
MTATVFLALLVGHLLGHASHRPHGLDGDPAPPDR